MTVQLELSGKHTLLLEDRGQLEASLKKPLSLKIHQYAVPVLKAVAVFFEIACVVEGVVSLLSGLSPIILVFTVLIAVGFYFLNETMSEKIEEMKDPKWMNYYSEAYRHKPLEDLMRDLPNRKMWSQLNWSGLEWKEKILPYARAHGMDRMALKEEFKKVFSRFDSHLTHYYREIELPLLQKQGFQALIDRSILSTPTAVTHQEIRAQLLKETTRLNETEAVARVGELPFYRGYLTMEDFSKINAL